MVAGDLDAGGRSNRLAQRQVLRSWGVLRRVDWFPKRVIFRTDSKNLIGAGDSISAVAKVCCSGQSAVDSRSLRTESAPLLLSI